MDGVFQSTAQHAAAGLLMYKKPTMLVLNQAAPRPEQFVTNGRTVWWYIPDENLVHRYTDVDVYGELKPLLDFFAGLGGLEGSFAVKVTPAGEEGEHEHRLDLTRLKTEGGGPREITVWFKPESFAMTGFSLAALTGESTVFSLSNLEINPGLADSIFTFRPPDGVEIIDEAGAM
jgi:outer membrane lipoprotein carrier protein